ncbi:hypothetical protein M427DRAFT_120957 [Gonapodya prolifera JEL478]|uniref:Uncharacterized protein n=1 Tax=Gonapodya prolifera (strain JEL478) TaxID=1344416 RepID=A0A139AQL7_GONPJ|nr:hypothetical protein M427DRAFT_120957 [Gonapodya prolifera JEL478]|eukprot:KXS19012.1 hypothetical protein M427DRAFT_120957 [Gonapodya prolifera JEL478]
MATSSPFDESDVALLKDGGDDLGGLNVESGERQREDVPGNSPDASSGLRESDQQSGMDSQLTEHKPPFEYSGDFTTATSGLDSVTTAPVGADGTAPMITSPQAPTTEPQLVAPVEPHPAPITLVVEDASEQPEVIVPEQRLLPSFAIPSTPTTPTSERNLSAFPTSPMSPFSDTSSTTFAYMSGGEESDAELLAAYRRKPEKDVEANVIPVVPVEGPSEESDPPADAERVQAPLLATSKPTLRHRRKMMLLGGLMVALAATAALTAGLVVRSRSTVDASSSLASSSGSSSDRQPVQPVPVAGNGSFGGLGGDNGPIVPATSTSRVQTTTATTQTSTTTRLAFRHLFI